MNVIGELRCRRCGRPWVAKSRGVKGRPLSPGGVAEKRMAQLVLGANARKAGRVLEAERDEKFRLAEELQHALQEAQDVKAHATKLEQDAAKKVQLALQEAQAFKAQVATLEKDTANAKARALEAQKKADGLQEELRTLQAQAHEDKERYAAAATKHAAAQDAARIRNDKLARERAEEQAEARRRELELQRRQQESELEAKAARAEAAEAAAATERAKKDAEDDRLRHAKERRQLLDMAQRFNQQADAASVKLEEAREAEAAAITQANKATGAEGAAKRELEDLTKALEQAKKDADAAQQAKATFAQNKAVEAAERKVADFERRRKDAEDKLAAERKRALEADRRVAEEKRRTEQAERGKKEAQRKARDAEKAATAAKTEHQRAVNSMVPVLEYYEKGRGFVRFDAAAANLVLHAYRNDDPHVKYAVGTTAFMLNLETWVQTNVVTRVKRGVRLREPSVAPVAVVAGAGAAAAVPAPRTIEYVTKHAYDSSDPAVDFCTQEEAGVVGTATSRSRGVVKWPHERGLIIELDTDTTFDVAFATLPWSGRFSSKAVYSDPRISSQRSHNRRHKDDVPLETLQSPELLPKASLFAGIKCETPRVEWLRREDPAVKAVNELVLSTVSHPTFRLVALARVLNKNRFDIYSSYKRGIQSNPTKAAHGGGAAEHVTEVLGFHGTRSADPLQISHDKLTTAESDPEAFHGRGVYIAESLEYSHHYAHHERARVSGKQVHSVLVVAAVIGNVLTVDEEHGPNTWWRNLKPATKRKEYDCVSSLQSTFGRGWRIYCLPHDEQQLLSFVMYYTWD